MHTSVSRRLYFSEVDGRLVCVGADGYAGPYLASDFLRVPAGCDPVGMTPGEVQDAEDAAVRERGRSFVAARMARAALA
jgi:hypothetical protein